MIKIFNYIFLFSFVISQSQVGTSAANFLATVPPIPAPAPITKQTFSIFLFMS